MEQINFNKLLLKTAFSCMACDGDIDPKEVDLIKSLHEERKLFGNIELFAEIEVHRKAINENSRSFLKSYLKELTSAELSEQDELKVIEVAIETIKADDKIEYSEVKFFKVIRSKLKIANEPILDVHPDFEDYLEQDIISESYLTRLQDDFFDTQTLPEFELISAIDDDTLKNLTENKDE
ncbi:MAG: TerB family tellurite resistance protein [Oceanicaulis sp.]|nr:TerB family tellurite resistance protein [Oceanicaulis sp.]